MNRSENIIFKWGMIEVFLTRASGAAESSEIDGENLEAFGDEHPRLRAPALFVESAAISENNRAGAMAIAIGTKSAAIVGRERNALLRDYGCSEDNSEGDAPRDEHAGIIREAEANILELLKAVTTNVKFQQGRTTAALY